MHKGECKVAAAAIYSDLATNIEEEVVRLKIVIFDISLAAQRIISNICNFFLAFFQFPPFSWLSTKVSSQKCQKILFIPFFSMPFT